MIVKQYVHSTVWFCDHAILYEDTIGHYVMDSTVTADPFVFCE